MIFALAAGAVLASATYRVGAADTSPPEPLPLGGYTARGGKKCELPGSRLEARAIVFQQANLSVAFVAVDLLTIPESLYDEVKSRMPQDVNLLLVATHTHCAPDSQMLNRRMEYGLPGIAKFDARWLRWHADRIASAVKDALGKGPTDLGALRLAIGRRELNRGRRPFAIPDTLATRLQTAAGEPLLTHYTAHPVLYGPAQNNPDPDYPGEIRGERGLFLPGAIGDMSPASRGGDPKSQIKYFSDAFNGGKWVMDDFMPEPVALAFVPLGDLKVQPNPEFARLNKVPEPMAETIIRRFAPPSGFLSVLRIGKLAVVGVPGEPSAEIGRRIRSIGQGMGFRHVLTVSHCNGWLGYILMPEDYDRGGYEASLAFHGRELAAKVLDSAQKGLDALRRSGRSGQIIFDSALHRPVRIGRPPRAGPLAPAPVRSLGRRSPRI